MALCSAWLTSACDDNGTICPPQAVLDHLGIDACEPPHPDPDPEDHWCPESLDEYIQVRSIEVLEACLSETRQCEHQPSINTGVACEDRSQGEGPCVREGRVVVDCSEDRTWSYRCWPIEPPFLPLRNDHCDGIDNDCDGFTDENGDSAQELAEDTATAWNTFSPPERDDDPATPDRDWPIEVCGHVQWRRTDPIWPNELIDYEAEDVLRVLANLQCHGAFGVSFDCALTAQQSLPICTYDTPPARRFIWVPGTQCTEWCVEGNVPDIDCNLPPNER